MTNDKSKLAGILSDVILEKASEMGVDSKTNGDKSKKDVLNLQACAVDRLYGEIGEKRLSNLVEKYASDKDFFARVYSGYFALTSNRRTLKAGMMALGSLMVFVSYAAAYANNTKGLLYSSIKNMEHALYKSDYDFAKVNSFLEKHKIDDSYWKEVSERKA